jgi:hypothetical protein
MNCDILATFPKLSLMTDSNFQFPSSYLHEARLRCHYCQVTGIAISMDCDLEFLKTFKQYPCSCCSQSLGNQLHNFEIHPYGSHGSVSWIYGHQNVHLHFITSANGAPPSPSERSPPEVSLTAPGLGPIMPVTAVFGVLGTLSLSRHPHQQQIKSPLCPPEFHSHLT